MKRTTLWLAIALLAVAGCRPTDEVPLAAPAASPAVAPRSAADPPAEAGASWRGFADSDTVAQLYSQQLQPLQGAPSRGSGCYYLRPSAVADQDVVFMIEADTFVRYNVRTGTRVASGGGQIEMTRSQLQDLHPESAELQPHKYDRRRA